MLKHSVICADVKPDGAAFIVVALQFGLFTTAPSKSRYRTFCEVGSDCSIGTCADNAEHISMKSSVIRIVFYANVTSFNFYDFANMLVIGNTIQTNAR